jgi:protoporphyrinogen oxidase
MPTKLWGIIGYIKTMIPFLNGKEPQNYQEWLYQQIGKPIADMLIIPQEHKKWKTLPSEMDHRWAPARVPRPDFKTLVQGAFGDTSHERQFGYVLRGGIEALMRAFAGRLHPDAIHPNAALVKVDNDAHIAYFSDSTQSKYDQMASTMPLATLVNMMTNVPSEIIETATKLTYISLKIACIVVDRPKISEKNFIYVHDLDYLTHRVSILSNLSPEMGLPDRSSITAEITYLGEPPMDDEAIIQRVIDDMIDMKILRPEDKVLGQQMIDIEMGYPMPSPDRIDNVKKIRTYLETQGIYTLGRYGEWEYINMHDIIPRSRDLAKRLAEKNERVS